MIEGIAVLIAGLGLLGGIIAVWLNLNLKVKEIETKLLSIEAKFEDIKEERLEMLRQIEKSNEKIWNKLDGIENKIDKKFEEFTVLKTEHEQLKNNINKK